MSMTMGVEEEFLLVDTGTGEPAPLAAVVLDKARRMPASAPDVVLQSELARTQVEVASGVCTDLAELGRQLLAERDRLARAASSAGVRLVPAGNPVIPGTRPAPSDEPRFRAVNELYQAVTTDYQTCGCHVHVGVPDRELAVAVVNHLRPWLPTLLALSVNSPYDQGSDTGYWSWRMVLQSRFPGAGVPPAFGGLSAYEREVARLVECGVVVDNAMTFWLARPSPHLPTVEVRAADTACTVEEALVQAALTRAMVAAAVADVSRGTPPPEVADQLAAAAWWSAARYGIGGPAVHPVTGYQVPATAVLAELLAWAEPSLEASGDLDFVRRSLATLEVRGTGADRQRAAGRIGLPAVVDLLAAELSRPPSA